MTDWWRTEFYSQFGEDSVLYAYFRAFEFAKDGRLDTIGSGFYADIGAHHPFMLSNTLVFYQRGWRGINVDPSPGVKETFDALRPEDVNLQVAITSTDGEATFYARNGIGAVDNTLDGARVQGNPDFQPLTVPTMRLSTLFDRYVPQGTSIRFLTVDVEGLDAEVLASNDWQRYRPELVVAEEAEYDIERIVASALYGDMKQRGYYLFGWTYPSLIFRRVPG